jgi:hypothetical protein
MCTAHFSYCRVRMWKIKRESWHYPIAISKKATISLMKAVTSMLNWHLQKQNFALRSDIPGIAIIPFN